MKWSLSYLLLLAATLYRTAASEPPKIHCGQYYTCAIRVDGVAACWGEAPSLDYGPGDIPDEYSETRFMDICTGDHHGCAVLERYNGDLVCWGREDWGHESPIRPPDQAGIVAYDAVSCGGFHNLALRKDGRVIAFGAGTLINEDRSDNQYGQSIVPAELKNKTVVAVSAGSYHSVALTDSGDVWAWGFNDHGQLNISSDYKRDVIQVAAGVFHTCVLRNDSMVACFGDNRYGQLDIPEDFASDAAMVAAGGRNTCIINNDGDMACFGFDEVGLNDIPEDFQSDVEMVSCSGLHCYAMRTDGTVGSWGQSKEGQRETPAGFENLLEIPAPAPAQPPSEEDAAIVVVVAEG